MLLAVPGLAHSNVDDLIGATDVVALDAKFIYLVLIESLVEVAKVVYRQGSIASETELLRIVLLIFKNLAFF